MSKLDWKNCLEAFLDYLNLQRGFSKNTIESYENDLLPFAQEMLKKNIKIESLSKKEIISYIELRRRRGFSSRTQARFLSALRSFYKFLQFQKWIDSNPPEEVDTPKILKSLPRFLSYEEVEELLSSPNESTQNGIRDKAMLELLYATGLRVSELINLKLNHLYKQMRHY